MNRIVFLERHALPLALAVLAALTAVALVARPMTPIDETRYISVAWEMWLRGDWLVPYKNGEPYSHKPPLMMWLYMLGWSVLGVGEIWPRLVSPLFSAVSLALALALARRLWPALPAVGNRALLILGSTLLWLFFSTSAMFDVILAAFTLLAAHGILSAAEGRAGRGFALLAVAIGFGVLAKGPVILLHTLPLALLAPWWSRGLDWKRWVVGVLVAVLGGAAIALAWAIPAGIAGGEEYQRAIFWGQTANRMVQSFAHKRPLWWYLPLLPLMFFPWLFWPSLWRGLRQLWRDGLDRGARFCLAWMLPVFLAFSLVSGKQMHYLIPIFPAFALLAARALGDAPRGGAWLPAGVALLGGALLAALGFGVLPMPKNSLPQAPLPWPALLLAIAAPLAVWRGRRVRQELVAVALIGVLSIALIQASLMRNFHAEYDTRPLAEAVAAAQAAGKTVANYDFYHDQYHFAGRLRQPLVAFEEESELVDWLLRYPDALVIVYQKSDHLLAGRQTIGVYRYMGGLAALMTAPEALALLRGFHSNQRKDLQR